MSADALNLLVVGSGLATRIKLKELLTASGLQGWRVRSATGVARALPLLDRDHYDAILFTLQPLGASRLDAISALNLASPEVPILAIAGSCDLLMARMALRAGADDYLVTHELNGPGLVRAIQLACERRQKLAQLTSQAWHDALTGLPNRALLQDRLAHMVVRARRYGGLIGVLFIDLDDFKLVNDSIGHAGGDELLCAVARRLSGAVRRGDTVARLGGDEFVVALENLSRQEDAEDIAAVIEARIREPFAVEGKALTISASIGIAIFGPEADNVDTLLRLADGAMYEAKRAKPSQV